MGVMSKNGSPFSTNTSCFVLLFCLGAVPLASQAGLELTIVSVMALHSDPPASASEIAGIHYHNPIYGVLELNLQLLAWEASTLPAELCPLSSNHIP